MTPFEWSFNVGWNIVWDMGREHKNHVLINQYISRTRYLQVRQRLRKYEFYATRICGPHVMKIRCTARDASHHGVIYAPQSSRRLGLTMFITKDDDPRSTEQLAAHLEHAARVTGWRKDEDGIMQPVYQHIKERV